MDLALLAHLYQTLVSMVDSGSKGGDFIDTTSTNSNSIRSSTTNSAYLLRTQSNQESLMRSKHFDYTSWRTVATHV